MLTEIQKKQIRLMVSKNPTVENMERVALLSDVDVLAELELFKISEAENINNIVQSLQWQKYDFESKINHLEAEKSILEEA
jgi:hypothetical protein